jgi:hypothetical protein
MQEGAIIISSNASYIYIVQMVLAMRKIFNELFAKYGHMPSKIPCAIKGSQSSPKMGEGNVVENPEMNMANPPSQG